MKCPSCGIWNRAHFTKCFRCGADLPGAAPTSPQEADSPAQPPMERSPLQPPENPVVQADSAAEPSSGLPEAPAPAAADSAQDASLEEIFSLYDEGNWDDDAEEDTETVYGAPTAPVIRPIPPLEEIAGGEDEAPAVRRAPQPPPARRAPLPVDEEEDDEPLTAYIAPHLPPEQPPKAAPAGEEAQPSQETRRFAPISAKAAVEEETRRFSLQSAQAEEPPPAPESEPEVAPADPGISHEIIHAIFTNPPASMAPEHVPDAVEEPRPRKLMSRKRLPPRPEAEEEPATVYKPKAPKAEPRVDHVEAFKPTARIAAQKADEQGDEFTAFATAKRNLVAEVEPVDPFDEAIVLPKPEAPAAGADSDAQAAPVEQPAPPKKEQPAWVKEALLNLGQDDIDDLHRAAPRKPARRAAPTRQEMEIEQEEPPTRYERPAHRPQAPAPRPPRESAPQPRPAQPSRSGLDAIARHEAGRSASILQRRAGMEENEEIPQSAPRSAARREVPDQEHTFRAAPPAQPLRAPVAERPRRAPQRPLPPREEPPARRDPLPEEAPMRLHSSRGGDGGSAGGMTPRGLRVQNLQRLIVVGVAALVLLGLLIWGAVAGVKALVGRAKNPAGASPTPSATPIPQADPNAPTITTGEVNGRPAHIITFKGNDGDIIYVSDENKENIYNIDIVGGQGELKIEDSALIGDRYVTEDVEVTLNPTLHEAGSGKETKLNPVTFTVTPPDAYLEIVSPAGGADETTLGTYQVKIRVQMGSSVTIDEKDVSDLIAEEDNGVGSIVFNVEVEPKGENSIPITVMQKGCKSVTQNITLTRPEMAVPIELDAATPSSVQSDTVDISGSVEPGVKVSVTSPTSGDVTVNDDGTFSFVAKFSSFGDNEVVIVATKGEESSTLTHVITYIPTYSEFVEKSYAMDYNTLTNFAGKFQPFLCTGNVVEILSTEPFACTYNVGTEEDPKYIYLEMVEGKPLEMGKRYKVYADVHADGVKDGYPYMIGRYFDLVNDPS